MKVIAYIDGFNLYYGALKRTPYKWLNVDTLLRRILYDSYSITTIKYFTARISPYIGDPSAPKRQAKYLRALKTLPHLEIYQGHFLAHPIYLPLIQKKENWKQELGKKMEKVCVFKSEEKGTDVNLACHLLLDAFRNKYDSAVIVSNDSDLFTPMEIVKNEFKKKVDIICPHPKKSAKLCQIADYITSIKKTDLQSSQFPEKMQDTKGEFFCPPKWKQPKD